MHMVYMKPREEVLDDMREMAERVLGGLDGVRLVTLEGDPAGTIVDQAVAIPADVVVMGTHGRSGFERLLIGSIAEKVVRKAPCPVLLVPPHMTSEPPAEVRFKRILCAMDFSDSSMQAFGFALDLARQADGAVTLLHALEWLPDHEPVAHDHFDVPEYRRYLVEAAEQRLQALVAGESQTWSRIEPEVVVGRAYRAILQHASETPADLIVMGAQGRGGLGLTLFGSTTEQVIRAATCPVLTVRGAGGTRDA
jgi:nucleotide-binding universal stress UspA family protein